MVDEATQRRALRAAVVGAATVLLAALAHGVAGARPPGAGSILVLAAVTSTVAVGLLRVRVSPARLAGFVVVAQAVLHETFMVAETPSLTASHASMPGMPGMPGMSTGPTSPVGSSWAMLHDHLRTAVTTAPGLAMTLAHATAAIVLGAWLARGERLCAHVASLRRAPWLAARLRAGVRALRIVAVVARALARWSDALQSDLGATWSPRTRLLVTRVGRRGPPATYGVLTLS